MRLGGCEELGATNDYDLAHLRTHVVRETTIASFVLVLVASGSWMHPRPSSRPLPPSGTGLAFLLSAKTWHDGDVGKSDRNNVGRP